MPGQEPQKFTLKDILITEELFKRASSTPDWLSLTQAVESVAKQMAANSPTLLSSIVDMVINLCSAGSAGISLLETTANEEEIFRTHLSAGALAQYVNGTTKRSLSFCDVCLNFGSPQLFSHPERYFTPLQAGNTPIVEALVLPLIADNYTLGTIWVMSHDVSRHFDSQDVRVMTLLADFTTAALLRERQTQELQAANAAKTAQIVERESLRALISNLPGGAVFVVDQNLRYLVAEGEALAIAGFQREDFVGRTIFEVLPPELATYYEPMYRQALAGKGFEHEHNAHDRSYISRGTPLRAENGEIYAVLAVSYDITERKRDEEQQTFLLKLSDAIRPLTDPAEIMTTVSESVGRYYNVGRCGYAEVLPPYDHLVVARDWTNGIMQSLQGTWPLVSFGDDFIRQYRSGQTVVVEDARAKGNEVGLEAAGNVRSSIAVQLMKQGNWVASFYVQDTARRSWTQNEVDLMKEIADRTWAAVERARAEADLHTSEEKYRSLFDSIDEGVSTLEVIFDENERAVDLLYLEHNQALTRLTGLTSDITGKRVSEVLPDLEGFWLEMYERVVRTGTPERVEHVIAALDRWFDVFVARVGGADSHTIVVLYNDITNRKLAEANLAFLAEISQDLARLTHIDETMNALGEKIGRYFNLSACVFAELSETSEIAVINYTWQLGHIPSFIGTYRMQDFVTPEVLQLCRAGEAVVIRNVFDDPLVDGEQYAALNIGSFLSIPLVRDGEWRFLLVIYHSEPYNWRDDEIELTHELANRIWTRLERARAEEQLRRAAQMDAFRVKLSDALRSLSNAVEIQATVTRTTMKFFGADRCYYCEIIDDNAIIRRDASQADLPTVVGAYPLENSPIFRAMLNVGQPFVFQDVHTTNVLDENLRQTCLQLQIIAGINVPVIKQGEPVGILTITQTTPRNWTTFEMDLAEEIADRTWATIERTRAEAALRESEIGRVREQSEREQERQRAESLAELDRAKTLFFNNVSHEFRTPLTLILAPVQDALSDFVNPLPGVQRDRLELAQRNAVRLLKLVNTLLDFSRIEAGRMEAVYEPIDLARFTTELASVFRSAIERAGLQLIVDCPPISECVYVDREMWEKIVLNLLSNAFKFTLEGKIAVRLHLVDGDRVTLQVEDTGIGIEPEQLPRLFERFYQVRGAKARTHEGSGIGLALVQELIKLHGGTLDVTSTPGVGSCFSVKIPLGTAHLPNDRLRLVVGGRIQATRTLASTALGATPYVQEAERWIVEEGERVKGKGKKDSSPPSPLPLTLSPSHILIVDDNADMRDYLTRILSEHHEVIAFGDGAAALAAVNEQVPDLVLSDVMMPELDGFGLLKALRADARTKEIPIILLSARAGEESIVEGLQAGADDYLIKPFSATELVTRVNAYLQMANTRSQALHQERTINRRKDEVLSTVSHELNTPLVAILGWTRLLQSNPPSPAMLSKALETIERNATLQAKLVQDLLDISRIAAGKISLNLEPVQLQGVIEQAIATVQQSMQTKDIHLNCQLAPSPVIVQSDSERLQQIILNLLTNAVKFTPNGGKIEISLQTHEHQAEMTVTDTGCGIDAEFLPYIFDTFSQAPSTKKGLGLGLAIARSFVELHGGTIAAMSPGIGQGTTFTVKLPLI